MNIRQEAKQLNFNPLIIRIIACAPGVLHMKLTNKVQTYAIK